MNESIFKGVIIATALLFTLFFCAVVMPPLIANPDIVGALGAGFVNPYAAGYSADAIACWFILAAWIWYEARTLSIRHGWICVLLGFFPGIAVGFAVYLLLRMRQLRERSNQSE